jgi:hypothetical protein
VNEFQSLIKKIEHLHTARERYITPADKIHAKRLALEVARGVPEPEFLWFEDHNISARECVLLQYARENYAEEIKSARAAYVKGAETKAEKFREINRRNQTNEPLPKWIQRALGVEY